MLFKTNSTCISVTYPIEIDKNKPIDILYFRYLKKMGLNKSN